MTKLKLTPAFIKKFHKFDEEGRRLVDVWTKRHSSKKDFMTAGAASGISAAFGSPIGGLLFAIEFLYIFKLRFLGLMLLL